MSTSFINEDKLQTSQTLSCQSCSRNSCKSSNAKIKLESIPDSKLGGILIVTDYPSSVKADTWFAPSKFFPLLQDLLNKKGKDYLLDTISYTSATRCGKSPAPTLEDAAICYKFLKEEILRIKPKVIIASGELAASMLCPAARLEPFYISYYRNTTYRITIDTHSCYLINSLSFYDLDKPPVINKFGKEVEDTETPLLISNVIHYAIQYMEDSYVHTINPTRTLFPFVNTEAVEIQKGVSKKTGELYLFKDLTIEANVTLLKELLAKIKLSKLVGFDYETNSLRPYFSGSKILSYSLSDGITTVSVLVNHITLPLSKKGKVHNSEIALKVLKDFLSEEGFKIIAHNLLFEMEWSLFFFGKSILKKVKNDLYFDHFVDTMLFKFFLPCSTIARDSRLLSLDDISLQKLGIPLKSLYKMDRRNMFSYSIDTLLEYNAGDAIVLPYIYNYFMEEAEHYQVLPTVKSFSEVIIATALIHYHGMPVNREALNKIKIPLEEKLKELELKILSSSFGEAFREKFAKNINVISTSDMAWVLYTYYNLPKQFNPKTNQLSVDKTVLNQYVNQVPDIQLIIDYKACSSFISKTLSTLSTGKTPQGAIVYEPSKGKIHFSLNPIGTETGRSSGGGGFNSQNIPKRGGLSKARDIFGFVEDDKLIIKTDAAQIDGRNAAAASADMNFIERINNNLDIHRFMATHVAIVSPSRFKLTQSQLSDKDLSSIVTIYIKQDNKDHTDKNIIKKYTDTLKKEISLIETFEENSSDSIISEYMKLIVKKIRDFVKAGLVFARIYRASANTISRNMQVSIEEANTLINILEAEIPNLPKWHKDLERFYSKYHAIRGFTGTIFYGPLDYGNIFNYTIQHGTRYFINKVMGKLAKANVNGEFKGILCNEVHDEVTVIMSRKEFEDNEQYVIDMLGRAFCIHEEDFFNMVSYGAEISISVPNEYGYHGWKTVKEIAVVTSKDYGWTPKFTEKEIQKMYERQFKPIPYTAPKLFL